jgi:hypothetical protein
MMKSIRFAIDAEPDIEKLRSRIDGLTSELLLTLVINHSLSRKDQEEVCTILDENEYVKEISLFYCLSYPMRNQVSLDVICALRRLNYIFLPVDKFPSLSGLEIASNVTKLSIALSSKTHLDFAPIAAMTKLEELEVTGPCKRVEDLFPRMTGIVKLSINGVPVSNYSWCNGLKRLEQLTISETRSRDLNTLRNDTLKRLCIHCSRVLSDISAISQLKGLRELELLNLYAVKTLCSFASMPHIEIISIDHLTKLEDLMPLLSAQNLKELNVVDVKQLMVDDFSPLKGLSSLRNGRFSTGTRKSSEEIHQMLGVFPHKAFLNEIDI